MADVAIGDSRLTQDCFFGERLILNQPAEGHRAGTDAVLLAAAAPRDFSGLVYDAGAGVGTAGLGVALISPAARVGLIESDALSAAVAAENIRANAMADRVRLHACDLLSAGSRAAAGLTEAADLVLTNPPFYEPGSVHASPDLRRRAAHVSGDGGLGSWIAACLAILRPRGTLIILHRTEALPLLLESLGRRAGALTLLPVHTKLGQPAKRILLRAVKGSRAPFAIKPAFVLRDGNTVTPETERINRGEIGLPW